MMCDSSRSFHEGDTMAERFGASVVIDRPREKVFAFLADGENDKKFSPRVIEISKTTDGPSGKGTIYKSTVKDAGFKTKREFELTEFESPTRIRWAERSKNLVTAPQGGYDLTPDGEGTRLAFFNELEGHGLGKLLVGPALKSARKGAEAFAQSIKQAVEAG
jgi:carbon monoxide dehydrogenase subunit G